MENTLNDKKIIMLSPYKMFVVLILGFAQGSIFLLSGIISQFYTVVQDMLDATHEQLGMLMTIYGVIMWITLIPGGWIADRVETRKLVVVSLILTGLTGFVMVAFPYIQYYYIAWGFMGVVHNLLYWAAAIKVIRVITEPNEQGKAYGYAYAANGAAFAIFGAIGVAMLAMAGENTIGGLKSIMIMYGSSNIILGILIWFLVRNLKKSDGTLLVDAEKPTVREMFSVLRLKETWVFSFVCLSLYSLMNLTWTYFTPFFVDVMGMSEVMAAGVFTAISFMGIFSPLVMGIFADKVGSILKTIMFVMAALIFILSTLLLITQVIPLWAAILIDVVAVFIAGGTYSIQWSAFDELKLDRKVAGSCVAMASIIGFSPDLFIWRLFGSFLDNHGNDGYFYIFASLLFIAVLGLIASTILRRWAKAKETELQPMEDQPME